MTRRYPKPWREKIRSIYSWHRWLGITSAVFVIWLAVTGLLLQHSDDIGLDTYPAGQAWLHEAMGIEIILPEKALTNGDTWLSHVDGHIYIDDKPVDKGPEPVGFTRMGLIWVIAFREALWLLNDRGEMLEKIEGLDLPGRIRHISHSDDLLFLDTDRGLYAANPLAGNWPSWKPANVNIQTEYGLSALPAELKDRLLEISRQQALTWSRLILEAHSGRLFGKYGVLVMDIMAGIFIILGLSGLALWMRYRRMMRIRRQRREKLPG